MIRRVFFVAACCAALVSTLGAEEKLSPALQEAIEAPKFKHAHWGILVVDRKSGEVVYAHNADKLFAPASTTKLYSVASALAHLGADYRFHTPIHRRGDVIEGELRGDLILVASGDLTMGGRTTENGEIAFTDGDHTYANGSSNTQLTAPDPLAGLDQLARQVASAGIKKISGQVLVDDRLFVHSNSSGSGPEQVTPILINDNVIDVTVTPGEAGEPAKVDWRPQGSFYQVDAQVSTAKAGESTGVLVRRVDNGNVVVRGRIAADHKPIVRIVEVETPRDWARSLLIDALRRADIEVAASADESQPEDALPERGDYEQLERVAEFESPPFSENAKLVLKVSHNLHASTLPLLVAAHAGKRTVADGLHLQHDFLKNAGVSVDTISFGGAAGGATADFTNPRANVELLRHMASRPDFAVYERGLPVLGVDGTLAEAVSEESPARGKAAAKTGTLYWQNVMNDRYLLTSKALAGYLTAKSGRELVISFVVNGVHIQSTDERNEIGKTLGHLCEIVFDEQ